jgi:hypothetical protein
LFSIISSSSLISLHYSSFIDLIRTTCPNKKSVLFIIELVKVRVGDHSKPSGFSSRKNEKVEEEADSM